jgi:hypothetical protein
MMSRELKKILYETVVMTNGLLRRLMDSRTDEEVSKTLGYIK